MKLSGLYIHIPFCRTRCFYCDFYAVASQARKTELLAAIEKELVAEVSFLGPGKPRLRTLYFGGGTPSLLTKIEFQRLFDVINVHFDLSACEEITLEANPDDLTPAYIDELVELPFNRISIGVQSFVDEELKAINRRHSASKAMEVVKNCYEKGLKNISIDLMYGLPGQTFESFTYSLEQAIALPVQHVSSYALSWEEGSVLYQKLQKGLLAQASDEFLESCFFLMKERLEQAEFEHYELSSFAKPGFQSKHNASYWDGTPYLGIGPSAHSFHGTIRRFNYASNAAYVQALSTGSLSCEVEVMDENAMYNDFIVTRLRTMKGLDLQELQQLFGKAKRDACLNNAAISLQNKTLAYSENRLILTPKGMFISDAVAIDLLVV